MESGYSHKSNVNDSTKLQFGSSWEKFLPAVVAAVGVLLILVGFLWNYIGSYRNSNTDKSGFEGAKSNLNEVAGVAGTVKNRMVKIDLSGSVAKPGVYEIPYDSRIQDVLIAAGGLSAKANRMYISKYLNLAQKVQDGMKIYIPTQDENIVSNSSGVGIPIRASANLQVSINNGTSAELESLPGIGPVTAQKVIAGRPYQDVSELLSRKIVSSSVFEKIKDKISL